MKDLRVGMIGYGFMGKAHSNAFRTVNQFFELEHRPVLRALCARNTDRAEEFARNWGYDSVEGDWRTLVERDDIDVIDICAPNDVHREIAVAAAEAGKWVLCEKPLAIDTAAAEAMVAAVEKTGVPNLVWYNYRRVPAIALARQAYGRRGNGKIRFFEMTVVMSLTMPTRLPGTRSDGSASRTKGAIAGTPDSFTRKSMK